MISGRDSLDQLSEADCRQATEAMKTYERDVLREIDLAKSAALNRHGKCFTPSYCSVGVANRRNLPACRGRRAPTRGRLSIR